MNGHGGKKEIFGQGNMCRRIMSKGNSLSIHLGIVGEETRRYDERKFLLRLYIRYTARSHSTQGEDSYPKPHDSQNSGT